MPQFGWQPHLSAPQSGALGEQRVGEVAERAHRREREPVAHRLGRAELVVQVVREVRERVALRAPLARREMSSSRPVKLTGWKETTVILSALSIAKLDDCARPGRR